jgi:hypothetical protein
MAASLRVEVVTDAHAFDLNAVPIAGVIQVRAIAVVAALQPFRLGAGPVRVDEEVLVERKGAVEPVRLVRARSRHAGRTIGEDQADAAAAQHVLPEPQHREIGANGAGLQIVVALDVQEADLVRPGASRQTASHLDGHRLVALQANAPAVEQDRRTSACLLATQGYAPEPEHPLVLEEELTFLREEQAEPCQVHLLLVGLHLREVGVVGEVGAQVLGHGVLRVEARVPAPVGTPTDFIAGAPPGGSTGGCERLQVEQGTTTGRRLQPHDRRSQRRLLHSGLAAGWRHARQRGDLVGGPPDAHGVEAPHLIAPWPVSQRFERQHGLHGPAALEAPGLHPPYRVPVAEILPFVDHLPVHASTQRVDDEDDRVAAVVEGVEDERHDVIARPLHGAVAAHLGGHQAVHVVVVALERHVDVVVVEGQPGLGAGPGRLAGSRLHLCVAAHPGHVPIQRLGQVAVGEKRLVHTDGADRGAA